jgi:hypothetical protein
MATCLIDGLKYEKSRQDIGELVQSSNCVNRWCAGQVCGIMPLLALPLLYRRLMHMLVRSSLLEA